MQQHDARDEIPHVDDDAGGFTIGDVIEGNPEALAVYEHMVDELGIARGFDHLFPAIEIRRAQLITI